MGLGVTGKLLGSIALAFGVNATSAFAQDGSEQILKLAPFVNVQNPGSAGTSSSPYFRHKQNQPQQNQPQKNNRDFQQNSNSMDENGYSIEVLVNPNTQEFTMRVNGEFVDPNNQNTPTGRDLEMSIKSHIGQGPVLSTPNQEIKILKFDYLPNSYEYADVEIFVGGYHGSNQKNAIVSPVSGQETNLIYKATQARIKVINALTNKVIADPVALMSRIQSLTSSGTFATLHNVKDINADTGLLFNPVQQPINVPKG